MKHSISPQFAVEPILFLLLHLPVVAHEVFVLFGQHRLEPHVDHPVEKVELDATVGEKWEWGRVKFSVCVCVCVLAWGVKGF